MFIKKMRLPGITVLLMILLLVLSLAVSVQAKTFIDWRAGFYVTYPDDWFHVPYQQVSQFLIAQDISWQDFDYDAVLARKTDRPFFQGPYIFMVFQPRGELTQIQIDSVLEELSAEYKSTHKEGALVGDVIFPINRPVYDRQQQAIGVKTRITSETIDKILIELWRFYEKGVAIFLCYAPKDVYNEVRPIFMDIFNSFSTKDIDQIQPEDSFEVVDLAGREMIVGDMDNPDPGRGGGTAEFSKLYYWLALIIIAVVAVWLIYRQRKSRFFKTKTNQ